MNRPSIVDCNWKGTIQWLYDVAKYISDMEKYCDELENKLKQYENLERGRCNEV